MRERLKNIVFVQVVIIIILGSALLAKVALVKQMTEYLPEYHLIVKK